MKPPHLFVVSAENSRDPDPARSGKRPSRGRGGGCNDPIGEEIGVVAANTGVLFNTARSDGTEY